MITPASSSSTFQPPKSPRSTDSETDVNASAESMVIQMRSAQPTNIEGTDETGPTDREEGVDSPQKSATGTIPTAVRTVPLIPAEGEEQNAAVSTTLESDLRVASTSRTHSPRADAVENTSREMSEISFLQMDEDNISSISDAPSLLGAPGRFQYCTDLSETEKQGNDSSHRASSYGSSRRNPDPGQATKKFQSVKPPL